MNIQLHAFLRALTFSLAVFVLSSTAHAAGRTLYVSNDGADSGGCGSQQVPCRSISQGIENAVDGDTIMVGAGRYGNISGSPTFGGPGDEHPQITGLGDERSDGCMICITKAVSIFSWHGASVTIIQGIPGTPYAANVQVVSDGVVFGGPGRGFTITGGTGYGVLLDNETQSNPLGLTWKRTITVSGNVDIGDSTGFAFLGRDVTDRPCPVIQACSTGAIIFSGNQGIDNAGNAFNVTENAWSGGAIQLQGNYARGAGTGFYAPGGIDSEGGGTSGSQHTSLTNNVATNNGLGFLIDAAFGGMQGNTAAGNAQAGFQIVPGNAPFQNNTAVGNAGPGVIINFSTDGDDLTSANRFSTFKQNDFFGNDRNRPPLSISFFSFGSGSYNPGPSAHCGVLNLGGLSAVIGVSPVAPFTPVPITLQANGNFWGTTHGPSATGAADAVGGACDQNGATTTAKTFATVGYAITTAQ